jgi:hypothetical protein
VEGKGGAQRSGIYVSRLQVIQSRSMLPEPDKVISLVMVRIVSLMRVYYEVFLLLVAVMLFDVVPR